MSIAAKVRTKVIGNEIVSLLRKEASSVLAKVVQFGDVMILAQAGVLDKYLPGIFVKPEVTPFEPLPASGTEFRVREVFRICLAFHLDDVKQNAIEYGIDSMETIFSAFNSDPRLSNIASTIRLDQIEESFPIDIDWDPEEDIFLRAERIPVKVIVARWQIQWLARRSS